MNKRFLLHFAFLVMIVIMGVGLVSCDDDDDGGGGDNSAIVGTWYDNMNDKRISMSFTFNSNGKGEGSKDTPTSAIRYVFSYSVKNNKVSCKGTEASAWSDGTSNVNSKWTTTFTLNGNTLVGGPLEGWTYKKFSY